LWSEVNNMIVVVILKALRLHFFEIPAFCVPLPLKINPCKHLNCWEASGLQLISVQPAPVTQQRSLCVPGFSCVLLPADLRGKSRQVETSINTLSGPHSGDEPRFWNSSCAVKLRKDCTSYHRLLPINMWPVALYPQRPPRVQSEKLICLYKMKEKGNKERNCCLFEIKVCVYACLAVRGPVCALLGRKQTKCHAV